MADRDENKCSDHTIAETNIGHPGVNAHAYLSCICASGHSHPGGWNEGGQPTTVGGQDREAASAWDGIEFISFYFKNKLKILSLIVYN